MPWSEPRLLFNNYYLLLLDYNQLFAATYVAPRDVDQFLWNVHPEPSTEQFCLKILNLQLAETNPVLFMFLSEVS